MAVFLKPEITMPHKTPDPPHRNGATPPSHPGSNEHSGSTGRPAFDPTHPGKNTGQGRYGQSGIAGGKPAETEGQKKYRNSQHQGDARSKQDSNEGSGRVDADETAKDIPKTG
jgi:hypothetical protein